MCYSKRQNAVAAPFFTLSDLGRSKWLVQLKITQFMWKVNTCYYDNSLGRFNVGAHWQEYHLQNIQNAFYRHDLLQHSILIFHIYLSGWTFWPTVLATRRLFAFAKTSPNLSSLWRVATECRKQPPTPYNERVPHLPSAVIWKRLTKEARAPLNYYRGAAASFVPPVNNSPFFSCY